MNERQHWELLVMLAPTPDQDFIETQFKMDNYKNPHNDYHKPKLRSREEIILGYKINFVKMLSNVDR